MFYVQDQQEWFDLVILILHREWFHPGHFSSCRGWLANLILYQARIEDPQRGKVDEYWLRKTSLQHWIEYVLVAEMELTSGECG
jgi:hypothetical protein